MGYSMTKKYCNYVAVLILTVAFLSSCNPVFPDYELDNFWKLNQIEYKNGVDFVGNECTVVRADSIYFGFARSLIQIQNLSDTAHSLEHGFSKFGQILYTGDSLRIDYSVYTDKDTNMPLLLKSLRLCGVENYVTTYSVDKLDNKELILSNEKVILNFKRW